MEKHSNNQIYDYIVIGAGASGLFFAARAEGKVPRAATSLILEKTDRPGSKLLMSGGGRCNITHAGPIKDFISHYGEHGKQIRRILYRHSNVELMNWLRDNGIHTITEADGRVFPSSMNARDILDFLMRKALANGFEIKTKTPVTKIERCGDLWKVYSDNTVFLGKRIVIATGGCSYPKTGSDGSMFSVLKRDLGLSITELRPSLSPVYVDNYPYADLSGISVNGAVTCANKKQKSIGAILFTHSSLSGPATINISGSLSPGDKLKINYLYPLTYDEVFKKLQDSLVGNKAQPANIAVEVFNLPKNLCRSLATRAGASSKAFARLLAEDEFTVSGVGGFDTAMVTRGGVSLDEVDLSTMELTKHPNIFVIGEALDIDGETGGYNLQFAYSSAICSSQHL